jgi:hypothetical protein
MKTILSALLGSFVIVAALSVPFHTQAAELATPPSRSTMVGPHCHSLRYCGPHGCVWHRSCHALCPDGYSCYPLYGAYGPYGGVAYWDGYTGGGWEYR